MSWLMAKDWVTGVEYSSLFHSGLRVISRRPRAHRAQTCSSDSSSSSSGDTSTTSMASLSSRLLRRRTTRTRPPPASTESSPTPPPRAPNIVRPRSSSMFVRPTKEMVDAWSSRTSFEMGDYSKFLDKEYLRAGYRLPPVELDVGHSRSFFVDLGETEVGMEEESFLLSDSSDGSLHHPSECLEVMPRETRRDCAWMLEESSPELEAYDPEVEIRPENEREVADWRQFHVDWVQSIR